jgi:hypothetical protein
MPGAPPPPASMRGALLPVPHTLHGVALNEPRTQLLHLFSFDYIIVVYLTTLSVVSSNEWMIVHNELERLRKEVAVA